MKASVRMICRGRRTRAGLAAQLGQIETVRGLIESVAKEMQRDADQKNRLWTIEDLAKRWGLSVRRARDQVVEWKIKPVKCKSRKVLRFRPCSVVKAEEDAERGPRRTGWLQ